MEGLIKSLHESDQVMFLLARVDGRGPRAWPKMPMPLGSLMTINLKSPLDSLGIWLTHADTTQPLLFQSPKAKETLPIGNPTPCCGKRCGLLVPSGKRFYEKIMIQLRLTMVKYRSAPR